MAKPWSAKRGESLSEDLDILLGDLCVHWGFCNGLSGATLMARHESLSSDVFATAVLTAEGMSPDLELEWHRKLRRLFSDRYGSAVSAQTYARR